MTVLAFLNTELAASVAAFTWLILAWIFERKPKFVGLLTGAIAGLATITPAAGFVSPASAVLIGFLAGGICYLAVSFRKKMDWDDALDVWGVHGIGGVLGIICLGIVANTAFNPAGTDGLLLGGAKFFGLQVLAAVLVVVWAFVFTYGMLWLINKITIVRVAKGVEEKGLDQMLHGELAYEEMAD